MQPELSLAEAASNENSAQRAHSSIFGASNKAGGVFEESLLTMCGADTIVIIALNAAHEWVA